MKTIEEINNMSDGEMVSGITATINGVWDQKSGTSEHGDWTRQFTLLKIGDETIGAQFWNYPDLKGDKGNSFKIESQKGKKGWHGITISQYEKDGKTVQSLKITDAAKMAPAIESNEAVETPADKPAASCPVPEKGRIVVPDGFDPIEKAKATLARVNNALYLAAISVEVVMEKLEHRGITISDINSGGMASQAFRAIDVNSLPTDPIWEMPNAIPPKKVVDDEIPF